MGVIAKLRQPTDWCAGMLIVPKPNSTVTICVNLTKLNASICCERYILPSVEETLTQLGDAKVFQLAGYKLRLQANQISHAVSQLY